MKRAIEWLLGGDTGTSSKTICAVMTGCQVVSSFGADIPHDPSDFGCCYRLLQKFPEWRDRMQEVSSAYPIWGPMVANWDELTALYEEEINNRDGKAPKLYKRMRELVDEGRLAAGWTRTSPNGWKGPKYNEVGLCGGATFRSVS